MRQNKINRKSRIITLGILLLLMVRVSGEERYNPSSCKGAQDYYEVAMGQRAENNFRLAFDFDQLAVAAACSNQSGNIAKAIEQLKFITNVADTRTSAWSELIFLQMEELVATLRGLITNAPPQTEQERAIFTLMMSLVDAYGKSDNSENTLTTSLPFASDISLKASTNSENLWLKIGSQATWLDDTIVPGVDEEIKTYLNDPNFFNAIHSRGSEFLNFIIQEIDKRELPIELALIPIVESSLNPVAISPRGAAGLWQIMPSTARQYGLARSRWYDERYDIRSSTNLALKHLEKLNNKFDGDWLLTLSAYNSGANRIKEIVKIRKNNWLSYVPKETQQYLARVFGLINILVKADEYGVKLPLATQTNEFVVVKTAGRMELPLAAQLADLELRTLRRYNPGYMRWAIPKAGYQELLLPPKNAALFEDNLTRLTKEQRMSGETYTVGSGENLISIANQLQVKVSALRSVNNIRRNQLWAGEKLLIPGTSYKP